MFFCLPFFGWGQHPRVNSIVPASGAVGTLVTLTGTNFTTPSSFKIGGTSAIVISSSNTKLVGMVMPGAVSGNISFVMAGDTTVYFNSFTVTPTGYPSVQQGNKLVATGNVGKAAQGNSVAISGDGNTAIVGGSMDNSNVGTAWIYIRNGNTWSQQGTKLIANNTIGAAGIGSVAISADGNTVIIGGSMDNGGRGAAWIFIRNGGIWTQQGNKLIGTGNIGNVIYQGAVSISADGNTIAVGAPNDNNFYGAAWVFTRNAGVWTQQGNKITGTGGTSSSLQGKSVKLSADGNTLVVGGNADNNYLGAVWVFTRNAGIWTQQGNKLVGTGVTGTSSQQGYATNLSADGNTAIIGGFTDVGGRGAVWIFTRNNGVWAQQGNKLVGTDSTISSNQGVSVSLSADGNTAFIGGGGDYNGRGAVWVFVRDNNIWTQKSKLLGIDNTGQGNFGISSAINADGTIGICGGGYDNNQQGAAWIFVSASTLPLQLLSFAAQQQNNTVTLNWQTANEVNSSHFNIERSIDGVSFTAVGKVTAKGDGSYSYSDDLSSVIPQPSTIFYRLQVADKDGSFTYSKTVSVALTAHNSQLTIFPNPVKEILTATITVSKAEKATLQVTDINGKVLLQKNVTLNTGSNVLPVNTAALAKGSYVLLIKGAAVQQKVFVKE